MSKLTLIAEPGQHEIKFIREFDAPRELVFKAYTDPALIPRWWGPKRLTTVVDKMDVHKGGMWRYLQHDASGNQFAFHGVYHTIVAPDRVVSTIEFEGMPGHVGLETLTFVERDGKTILTNSGIFQTVADRDGMLQTGMEEGAAETWDRFADLLKTLKG